MEHKVPDVEDSMPPTMSWHDTMKQGRILGGGLGGLPLPKDYPADSEIWRKGVADRL